MQGRRDNAEWWSPHTGIAGVPAMPLLLIMPVGLRFRSRGVPASFSPTGRMTHPVAKELAAGGASVEVVRAPVMNRRRQGAWVR